MQKRQLGPCVTFFPQPTTLVSTVGSGGAFDATMPPGQHRQQDTSHPGGIPQSRSFDV
jgi:hypothetical protein